MNIITVRRVRSEARAALTRCHGGLAELGESGASPLMSRSSFRRSAEKRLPGPPGVDPTRPSRVATCWSMLVTLVA